MVDRRKPVVFVAVIGAHVLFVAVVVWQTRLRTLLAPRDQFASVVTFIAPERAVSRPVESRQPQSSLPSWSVPEPDFLSSAPVEESAEASVPLPPTPSGPGGIDWLDQAHRTVDRLSEAEAQKVREAERRHAELHSSTPSYPIHHYGEEEASRELTREWVSEHCYVESQRPPLGAPPLLARALSAQRMGCIDPPLGGFSGEMFKGLPAFEREHDPGPAMKAAQRSGAAQPPVK